MTTDEIDKALREAGLKASPSRIDDLQNPSAPWAWDAKPFVVWTTFEGVHVREYGVGMQGNGKTIADAATGLATALRTRRDALSALLIDADDAPARAHARRIQLGDNAFASVDVPDPDCDSLEWRCRYSTPNRRERLQIASVLGTFDYIVRMAPTTAIAIDVVRKIRRALRERGTV